MNGFRVSLFLSASLLFATPALAQSSGGEQATPGSDDLHGPIVVTAAGLRRLDVLAGSSVMDGTELQRNLDAQIGEVLAKLPGVSASSFSPGASRPVLRGFGGERVRVLTDGIGAIDASSTSADHAVTVDPLIAERIEVLRGPAVLLYGSQAIGGAVNVITRRIPPRVADEAIHVDASAGVDSAANKREGGLSLDIPLGRNVAFHVDGSYRNTDNLEIPGYVASQSLRADMLARAAEEEEEGHLDEAEEIREGANTRGTLPNSWTETYTLGTGIAFFSGESNIGVSFDYYDTNYGVPGLPGVGHVHEHEDEGGHEEEEDHGHEEGDVSIGMKRYRADLRGELDLGEGFFDKVQTRWGYSDYTHTEFEGDEIGTVFDVEGVEGRVELVQSLRGGWQGSIGSQYSHTDFSASGDEAFVPSNKTDSIALFTVQELYFDPFEIELGGRYERTGVDARQSLGLKRDFDTFSGAFGMSYGLAEELRAGFNISRAERAPSAQELFADGPHVATQQYEIGNSALDTESSWGVEGYVRGEIGGAMLSASIYRNWFDGFIFLSETGAEEDGLEVFQFLQQDADQFGIEGQITLPVHEGDGLTVLTDLRGDYVRATLADGSPVPRIPPLSLLAGLEAQFGHFDARAEVQWFDKQTRVSEHETPTDDFAFVNLSLAWHPLEGTENVTFMAQVDNLFDAQGRRHASFTKDFVPLAGRNFKVSARLSF
ncbi:iron complex outermembrane receptor protein [Altererythrobacter atlanticus]|uniref:TonB-dependent receptor n=1 Tax=Croceibacterium atlanticum TaxID=1267766 RepID=A0A0F7KTD4_9SPHN|nr:TonB-dependent receptor [Croceibacterium atlanticum]AKH43668.1 putative TonB-dependent receptor precursor [Croceibacterium atlanticum]MBB5733848.1 iron complex outermembrane receptor protein [Croceibacterium atlanticum]